MKQKILLSAIVLAIAADTVMAVPPANYADGRPQAQLRVEAKDEGIVLKHGGGPGDCDIDGARDVTAFESGGTYYLQYDGAGKKGWLTCLATSKDLVHWEKHGAVLDFGKPGTMDSASASQSWVIRDGGWWHAFYLGTPNTTPEHIPAMPYQTFKARSRSPVGPWEKQYDAAPFKAMAGTYYGDTASPGFIVKRGGEFLMFFSAASITKSGIKRTLSIARTKKLDGPWTVQPEPILSSEEQIENSSLYYEPKIKTWFLFCNHIGLNQWGEFTDAIWVYWSKDLEHWDASNKAVVLDGRNCKWSRVCIGMASVVRVGKRLAVLYDAAGADSTNHLYRDIGLAWLELPLRVP